MVNAMTVDLEDWYQSIEAIPTTDWNKHEPRVIAGIHKRLQIFKAIRIH